MMFEKEGNGVRKDGPDICYAYRQVIAKDQPDDTRTYASSCNM